MNELKCCVIVATFNNGGTLGDVLRRISKFTQDVIVVNDGSTDQTESVLAAHSYCRSIHLPVNKGKGNALRTGFTEAAALGFKYAITIDSDGQHYPEDIPLFVDMIREEPDSIIIGARDMNQEGVPGTSNFGHKFSIFWFRVETGLSIPDVQSGYRAYPLEKIRNIRFYGIKYEFEVEVLVRSAWRNINIESIPVRVWYAPKDSRVSHFRKFRDFGRTTVLNVILVFMAILWVRPFLFMKDLKKKSVKEFFREYIMHSKDTNIKLAASVGLGAFFSSFPIWGWQMVAAVTTAYFLKLNKFVTLAFSNLSIPPVMPVIIFLSYVTGGWILGNEEKISYSTGISLEWIKQNIVQYLVGSVVFSIALGVVFLVVSLVFLSLIRKNKIQNEVKEEVNG